MATTLSGLMELIERDIALLESDSEEHLRKIYAARLRTEIQLLVLNTRIETLARASE